MKLISRCSTALAILHLLFSSGAVAASDMEEPKGAAGIPPVYMANELPKAFKPDLVPSVLLDLRPRPVKGEFETSHAFEARHNAWVERPFKTRKGAQPVAAFSLSQLTAGNDFEIVYDADAQTATARVHLAAETPTPGLWLQTFWHAKNLGQRRAVTRMGVPFNVEMWRFSATGLSVRSESKTLEVTATVPAADAPKLKPNLAVLVVAELEEPFKASGDDYETASLDSPIESTSTYHGLYARVLALLLYDPRTGKVYGRNVGPF